MSRLGNLLLEQSRNSNLEQLLISKLTSLLLLEQSSVSRFGQRLTLNILIEVFEQLSLVRSLTSNSVNLSFDEQSSLVIFGQSIIDKLVSLGALDKLIISLSLVHPLISKLVNAFVE
ncbi:hypothetical protein RIR_jg37616.t1 [Rhizophagus irregularis DAOM 181602=DAOM 197198]|uniref:Uncharacterized protein n=1 Tax=Rhizophagus irregularis (strain DAOM 197198w) TaxID=1432141 RepID=A0A015NFI9_RHIIW|nr:hypothetical protein RirG_017950 [Rhizophagus irregularis DAOM 197198w]GET50600.1 hypothetical protein RIR_jg38945.t1 [Rhizophagus irregularis DAOM 181602=DAOM 197198]GET52735.1 hypothetical protein RIR_jg37616.t1 [Rhizophagus irregularis DAOM 181602=DAOM 197198]